MINKSAIAILFLIMASISVKSQTAVNFSVNDCNNTPHELFKELDEGKVIVLVWVMPCASCIAPSISAFTEVQAFSTVHPGKVKYYMADDYGTTACATLVSWANNNGISPDAVFSNKAVNMSDYSGSGMPKIVVISGKNHQVVFNQNDELDAAAFRTALATAFDISAGMTLSEKTKNKIDVHPNPSFSGSTTFQFETSVPADLSCKVFNIKGDLVKTLQDELILADRKSIIMTHAGFSEGVYFAEFSSGNQISRVRFVIAK